MKAALAFMLLFPLCAVSLEQSADSSVIAKMRASVSHDFKDPDSARWRSESLSPISARGSRIYCGEVNAKNSFGAYVGFVRAYAMLSADGMLHSTLDDPTDSTVHRFFEIGWDAFCKPK